MFDDDNRVISGGEKPEHHDPLVRSHLFSSGDIIIRPGSEGSSNWKNSFEKKKDDK